MQTSEGAAVLAGETRMRAMSRKGYYAPSAWDVYWTARKVRLLGLASRPSHEQHIPGGTRSAAAVCLLPAAASQPLPACTRLPADFASCSAPASTPFSYTRELPAQECHKALPYLMRGQRVSCLPGITALTDKAALVCNYANLMGTWLMVPHEGLLDC